MEVLKLNKTFLKTRVKWLNHELIRNQMPVDYPFDMERTINWYENIKNDSSRFDFVVKNDKSILGYMGLVNCDFISRNAELYIFTDPEKTGKGIGSFGLQWLCNYGFENLNLHKILLYTVDLNDRARNFYEKHNFKEEGCLKEHLYFRGKLRDRYIHSTFRKDWKNS